MSEWKEYTGSDGQIAQMRQSEHGFVARNTSSVSSIMSIKLNQLFISGQKNPYLPELFGNKVSEFLNYNNTTHYLICDPHPLADMICKQARTGQPVWVKMETSTYWVIAMRGFDLIYQDPVVSVIKSTTPDWNIPDAAYSFTPFDKEEV